MKFRLNLDSIASQLLCGTTIYVILYIQAELWVGKDVLKGYALPSYLILT